ASLLSEIYREIVRYGHDTASPLAEVLETELRRIPDYSERLDYLAKRLAPLGKYSWAILAAIQENPSQGLVDSTVVRLARTDTSTKTIAIHSGLFSDDFEEAKKQLKVMEVEAKALSEQTRTGTPVRKVVLVTPDKKRLMERLMADGVLHEDE